MTISTSQTVRTQFLGNPSFSLFQTPSILTLLRLSPPTPDPTLRSFLVAVSASLDAKPTMLVSEKFGEAGLKLLNDLANANCPYNLSPEELCTKISLCDALIVRSGTKVTREVFESCGWPLKVVGKAGVGIDTVDLVVATEHGCLVVNAPTANTVAAAEHGITLLATMARNVAQADAYVKAGNVESVFDFGVFYSFEHLSVCLLDVILIL